MKMTEIIYKVAPAQDWQEARDAGVYQGSADDLRDGYIHFSTAAQVPATLAKHYAGREGLVLIAVEARALGDKLVWEPSRGGDLFPHLYAPLPVDAALWYTPLMLQADGTHELPGALPDQLPGEAS
jgi:uncharacterized protein (DUF952 family)